MKMLGLGFALALVALIVGSAAAILVASLAPDPLGEFEASAPPAPERVCRLHDCPLLECHPRTYACPLCEACWVVAEVNRDPLAEEVARMPHGSYHRCRIGSGAFLVARRRVGNALDDLRVMAAAAQGSGLDERIATVLAQLDSARRGLADLEEPVRGWWREDER